jgi:hypothetical protein
MRSFIYASTAMSVVTERQGRTGIVGMNLRNEDPARPRFDGGPAAEQPRCRLDIPSRCLRATRLSSCRPTCHGEQKHHATWLAVQSGGSRCSAASA